MHRFTTHLLPLTFLLALSTAVLAACGGDDGSAGKDGRTAPAGSIQVNLVNWAVNPSESSAKAGKVTFWAVHEEAHAHDSGDGGLTHDLQVMKKQANGSFETVGQVQGLKIGEAKALTLTLSPGDYELACTVVETVNGKAIAHYAKGMHTAFTVV